MFNGDNKMSTFQLILVQILSSGLFFLSAFCADYQIIPMWVAFAAIPFWMISMLASIFYHKTVN